MLGRQHAADLFRGLSIDQRLLVDIREALPAGSDGNRHLCQGDFSNATFLGDTDFDHYSFDGGVDFSRATFEGRADFADAHFSGSASFA
jgi:uncharacterized protein YjbI with pentapeptide repeats